MQSQFKLQKPAETRDQGPPKIFRRFEENKKGTTDVSNAKVEEQKEMLRF